jgi:hypothetical protein
MTNKVVDITIKKLDATQVMKMRAYFNKQNCNRGTVHGAYMYELRELLDAILDGAYANKSTITAPNLTI